MRATFARCLPWRRPQQQVCALDSLGDLPCSSQNCSKLQMRTLGEREGRELAAFDRGGNSSRARGGRASCRTATRTSFRRRGEGGGGASSPRRPPRRRSHLFRSSGEGSLRGTPCSGRTARKPSSTTTTATTKASVRFGRLSRGVRLPQRLRLRRARRRTYWRTSPTCRTLTCSGTATLVPMTTKVTTLEARRRRAGGARKSRAGPREGSRPRRIGWMQSPPRSAALPSFWTTRKTSPWRTRNSRSPWGPPCSSPTTTTTTSSCSPSTGRRRGGSPVATDSAARAGRAPRAGRRRVPRPRTSWPTVRRRTFASAGGGPPGELRARSQRCWWRRTTMGLPSKGRRS